MYIKFIYFITIISLEWSLTSIPYFFVCAKTNILILLGLIQSSLFYVYSYKWNNLIIFLWTMYKQILLIINFQLVHIRFWRTFFILMYVLSLNLSCLLCFFSLYISLWTHIFHVHSHLKQRDSLFICEKIIFRKILGVTTYFNLF